MVLMFCLVQMIIVILCISRDIKITLIIPILLLLLLSLLLPLHHLLILLLLLSSSLYGAQALGYDRLGTNPRSGERAFDILIFSLAVEPHCWTGLRHSKLFPDR